MLVPEFALPALAQEWAVWRKGWFNSYVIQC